MNADYNVTKSGGDGLADDNSRTWQAGFYRTNKIFFFFIVFFFFYIPLSYHKLYALSYKDEKKYIYIVALAWVSGGPRWRGCTSWSLDAEVCVWQALLSCVEEWVCVDDCVCVSVCVWMSVDGWAYLVVRIGRVWLRVWMRMSVYDCVLVRMNVWMSVYNIVYEYVWVCTWVYMSVYDRVCLYGYMLDWLWIWVCDWVNYECVWKGVCCDALWVHVWVCATTHTTHHTYVSVWVWAELGRCDEIWMLNVDLFHFICTANFDIILRVSPKLCMIEST